MLKSNIHFWFSGAPKNEPQDRFSIIGHMVAYGSNAPQTSTICRPQTVIKSVLWLISNGCLVAEIWTFQVLGWCGAPKLSLHSVYMQWQQTLIKLGANQNTWFTWRKVPCERMYTRMCPACMQQAVPDRTSPRVYLSPGGAGARLSGPNKLFFGYSILGESVFGPVLPRL